MLQLIKKYRSAIMGFAALWVLAFHVSFPMAQNNELLSKIETVIKRFGFGGVDIFLFLSGMGLVYAIQKSSLGVFYIRRVQRIIVPFVLMGILKAVLEEWSFLTFMHQVFFYNFFKYNIYSFLWFVPMIIVLYTLFPLYFKIFKASSNKVVFTMIVLIFWLIISLCLRDKMRTDVWGFTNRIPVFVVGILFGWISQYRDIEESNLFWFALASMLILGVQLAYLTNYREYFVLVPSSNCCVPTFLMAISLCFLIAKSIDILITAKYLNWFGKGILKILEFYGTITIELYCVQEYLVSKFLYPFLKVFLANVLWNIPLNVAILLILTAIATAIHYGASQMWKWARRGDAGRK